MLALILYLGIVVIVINAAIKALIELKERFFDR